MEQLTDLLNEMYESRNMVLHLKNKFNVDNKMPVEVASAIGCTRITHALQKRYVKFLSDNLILANYGLWSRLQLRDLNEALGKLNLKFTEDDEDNLSNQQKEFLSEKILGIEKALLNIGGRITVELEAKGGLNNLTVEQREFADESKLVYIEVQKEDEQAGQRHAKAVERDVDISEIEEEEDANSGFTLGSSNSDTPPKQIITTDIEV